MSKPWKKGHGWSRLVRMAIALTVIVCWAGITPMGAAEVRDGSIPRPESLSGDINEGPKREKLFHQLTGQAGFLDSITLPGPDTFLGQCVEWGGVFYMMPLNMTDSQVQTFVDSLPELPRDHRYQPFGNYWTRTATNGNVSVPGQRITLTWSFVPDGTMIRNPVAAGELPSNLFAAMSNWFPNEEAWKDQFRRAFNEFGDLIGVNYQEVEDDGANQPAIGALGLRGDVRISMIAMGAGGPLAVNYYPMPSGQNNSPTAGYGGDMVFNSSSMNTFANPAGSYRALRNVTMHEHGHGIGFRHVDPINRTKLMEAFLATNFDGPQEDDIRGFQSAYGDRFEVNDTAATATNLGAIPTVPDEAPRLLEQLAMENSFARDYYRVDVPDLTILRVRVEPIGTIYQQGPQGGAVSNVNGREVLDLVVDIMDADGVMTFHTADETSLGGIEEAEVPLLLGPGEYAIRVRSKGSSLQSQRYRMWVSRRLGTVDPTYVPALILVDDSAGNSTGTPDPGERNVELIVPLRNIGFSVGPPVAATLVSETPTVVVTSATADYGPAFASETVEPSAAFRFNVSEEHECGAPIQFRLVKSVGEVEQESVFDVDTGILGDGPFRHHVREAPGLGPLPYLSVSTIEILDDFPVGRVRLSNLNVTGSTLENHRFTLISPEGLQLVLSDGNFRGSNLRETNLRDEGIGISTGIAPYTGTYRPANSFSGVGGGSSLGTWQFMIINKTGARAATIDSWTLELAPFYEEPFCAAPLVIVPSDLIQSLSIY